MKPRWIAATIGLALLAATAGLIATVGVGDADFLAGTSLGRWLGVRPHGTQTHANEVAAIDGQSIGPLALTDLDGQTQPLPAPAGRRVLVNVWASWCVPCRSEMPLLAQFAKAQGPDGVVVVGIAEDQGYSVRDFLLHTPVGYPILLDDAQWRAGSRLGNRLGVLPYTALIDPEGHLLRHQSGPFASVDALRQWVNAPD
ncbi:MAG TPA: TlpA disulfide reductase family protein [Xanthomonadaceae bacterium]|jgi:thiol-disulfide isomerase/thioredoxin